MANKNNIKITSRHFLGKKGENLAVEYSIQQGWKILARNYHATCGEIDIIAQDQDEIVFIEVKTRKSDTFGDILESIPKRKMEKMRKTAETFLLEHAISSPYRFDAILIFIDPRTKIQSIEHIKAIISE